MTRAYDESYLADAQYGLGFMLDFAVNDLGFALDDFFGLFLVSAVEAKLSAGDCSVVGGRSGAELAYLVLEEAGVAREQVRPSWKPYRSREFWCGWALAAYQWESGLSFERIAARVPVGAVWGMYEPYHEMELARFVERMGELMSEAGAATELRQRRERAGLTREQLASASGVPLRTIEQYEQRRKDVNKAQAATLLALARVLHCTVEDLMEG